MMKNKIRRETQTVEGLLIPCQWDDDGSVIEMEIQGMDEETYGIENSEFFLNIAGKSIQASGVITTGKRGGKRIFIKRIAIMEHDSQEEVLAASMK